MKIVFLSSATGGGPETDWMAAAARGLDERGHDVHLIAPAGSDLHARASRLATRPLGGVSWGAGLGLARWALERRFEIAVDHGVLARRPILSIALRRSLVALGRLGRAELSPSASRRPLGFLLDPETAPAGEDLERTLESKRLAGRGQRRAVFLDRDGTLMPEMGALGRPDAVRLLPGVPEALRALDGAGFALVVVSNQAAVGRGVIRLEDVHAVHAELRRRLRAEGVELAGIFFCPHRPEDRCRCRKPEPGLLLDAAAALGLSLADSWLIGDSTRDVEAASRAGARPVLVTTGWGGRDPAAPASDPAATPIRARDLRQAARVILGG